MSQYNAKFDLKTNVGHSDLYFTAQYIFLLSWRVFDVQT